MEKSSLSGQPASVKTAVNLIWLSTAIGLIAADLMAADALFPPGHVVTLVVALGLVVFFVAFILRKISRGKNWARITYLVLFVFGSLQNLLTPTPATVSPIGGWIGCIAMALQAYALYLLFKKPGSCWFKA